MKKRKPKIKVSYQKDETQRYDFGAFKAPPKFHIEVSEKLWIEYLDARLTFELLHDELVKLVQKNEK